MSRLAVALALTVMATMAGAQEIEVETKSVVMGAEVVGTSHVTLAERAAAANVSSNCSGGVVYDDGEFDVGYSIGNGDPGDATMVMRFDLPAGTTKLDQVCTCFNGRPAGHSSMGYEIVVYDDDGLHGEPGTFLGSVAATATSIPENGAKFFNVDMTASSITLPDTRVYIGARWPGGDDIFMCGDTSVGTPERMNFESGYGGGGGTWMELLGVFGKPRAMGIRTDPAVAATCTSSSTALCLNNGRFKVEATFEAAGQPTGIAHVVQFTDEAGYLWFFSAVNVEAVIKVINACSYNDRFWVFAAGLTDVETTIVVTDTKTGATRTYVNPQGTPFHPIQDTSAFATCSDT
jgi:hypothetical protein